MSSRSRWLLIALLLLIAAVCARLGIWQLHRLHQRRAANAIASAARSAPPVQLHGAALRDPGLLVEHRVEVRGRYDRGHEIVLRQAGFEGVPGVLVVTPLLIGTGDTAVLVNRGFVPAPDAVSADVDSLNEPGAQLVRGIAAAIGSGKGMPILYRGRLTWRELDLAALRSRLSYTLLPIVIRQTPDSALPSFPRRLEPEPLNDGPHLSYAVQWFFFAVAAVAFALLVVARQDAGTGRGPSSS